MKSNVPNTKESKGLITGSVSIVGSVFLLA